MAFKCLTHAHTILVGLVLSWKEDKRETLTHSGSSYWGTVSSGAFGTYQRVTLARVPQLLPWHLPVGRGSLWERRRWGKRPQGPCTSHQKCHGKEFPDMRQKEREIQFIRVGDAVRTVGQPKGEPTMLLLLLSLDSIVVVQLLSCVQLFVTSWTIACQVSLSLNLLNFAQTCVRWIGDVIQPSHPLLSSPAFSLSQHQGLFQWVRSPSHQVAKVLELQHHFFQWIFRVDFL